MSTDASFLDAFGSLLDKDQNADEVKRLRKENASLQSDKAKLNKLLVATSTERSHAKSYVDRLLNSIARARVILGYTSNDETSNSERILLMQMLSRELEMYAPPCNKSTQDIADQIRMEVDAIRSKT